MKRYLSLFLVLLLTTVALTLAQDETFTDGYFTIPAPEGWTNESTDTLAHFISPDEKVHLYVASTPGDDVEAAKADLLAQINPEFDAEPVQSNDVPLPDGTTWVQDLYIVDGLLWAVVSTVQADRTYVMVVYGDQASFMGASAAINTTLIGLTYDGAEPLATPDYFAHNTFTEEEVTIISGDYELPATLTLPFEAEVPVPAVILVSGSGASNRDEQIGSNRPLRDLAWGLASNGIGVLRFDERTFVYGAELDMETFTIDDEVTDDVLAGIQLLRENGSINPDKIYVVGHSLGAMVAPRIGEQDPDLAGLVLIAGPARNFEDLIAEQIEYLISQGTPEAGLTSLQPVVEWMTALRSGDEAGIEAIPVEQKSYLQSLVDYDQVATAQGLTMPMLILQGERDYQVTMGDFALWQDALADRDNITYISYPALNHLMMAGEGMQTPAESLKPGYVDGQVIDDIVNWIWNTSN